MKVGFVASTSGGAGWLGGRSYFRNLFAAIDCLDPPGIETVVFTGPNEPAFPGKGQAKTVRTQIVRRWTLAWLMRYGVRAITSRDRVFERLLRRHDVSVLSHAQHLGRGAAVAALGWIGDFQHLHLPEFFSENDRRARDRQFTELCERCDRVIVSSACAKADLASFLPQYVSKAVVLPFVSAAEPPDVLPELPELQRRYSFEQPYFILPNQFWAHKNHRVVIDALRILKSRNQDALVLATGATEDHRNLKFFPELMSYVKECGVLDVFRVLGIVSSADLFSLMRHSVAFINPSRFEGWSTSVEEAKSMGKALLLSDIPVHREQSPELGLYFRPDDAEGLARQMQAGYENYDPGIDAEHRDRARARLPENQKRFARSYEKIVMDADMAKRKAGKGSL
jgi:glycosyltransferase involved in cell wall biosynthesis